MKRHATTWLTCALSLTMFLAHGHGARASQPQTTRLADLLDHAAHYVEQYEPAFGTVLSEEKYYQDSRGGDSKTQGTRTLRSDVMLINQGDAGWITFRDVFEVDGKPVRERTSRLEDLLLKPKPDALEQAKRIIDEGARFNVGGFERTLNTPTLALVVLRRSHQPRFEFALDGTARVDGVAATKLTFHERGLPRLIATRDDGPAAGTFWIDPANGEVLKSDFDVTSVGVLASIVVSYGHDKSLAIRVPTVMNEDYAPVGGAGEGFTLAPGGVVGYRTPARHVTGRATYGKFRQISVDVSSVFIKR